MLLNYVVKGYENAINSESRSSTTWDMSQSQIYITTGCVPIIAERIYI
jgi:hypothetical protein